MQFLKFLVITLQTIIQKILQYVCCIWYTFNHESPLRGEEFVTRKIILGLVKILKGDLKYLELGNIYAKGTGDMQKNMFRRCGKCFNKKT